MSAQDVQSILKLRVPVIVRLAARKMDLRDVMNLAHGSLVELPRPASEPLDLMVNNKLIGSGTAVKVGENFGLQVASIGDPSDRLRALAPTIAAAPAVPQPPATSVSPGDTPGGSPDGASAEASGSAPASDAPASTPAPDSAAATPTQPETPAT